jgi:HlyD family secretion protein
VVTYTTVIEVANDDLKLRPGMTANLNIIVGQKMNVMKVPNAALRVRPPEESTLKAPSNTVAGAKGLAGTNGSNAVAKAGEGSTLPDVATMSREERGRRFESMTPEQRAAMRERRARMREEGGGGARFGGSGENRSQQEGPGIRTVYLLVKTNSPSGKEIEMAKPVTIKTGLSDTMFTEVVEGLSEGDEIITGLNQTGTTAAMNRPGSTPFGGPFGGGFRPR